MERRSLGHQVREAGPKGHAIKSGTPTLGGIAIIFAAVIAFVVEHIVVRGIRTRAAPLVLLAVVGAGLVGFLDDWLKLRRKHNQGLNKRAKFGLQLALALLFALLAEEWAGVNLNLTFTRYNLPGINLGHWGWAAFAVLVIVGTSNAVNFTDGLDGLAAGSSSFAFVCLAVLAYWQFRHPADYKLV
ncbi:MAG: phospho-N-acetylmuramoyl-pentapeptide-transferase, partial [Acidimicrobiales bacterium]|nr:phospho-N-acetylmuramoyl-pentapeptide-transferase [Acidimicrobiales bacterium]